MASASTPSIPLNSRVLFTFFDSLKDPIALIFYPQAKVLANRALRKLLGFSANREYPVDRIWPESVNHLGEVEEFSTTFVHESGEVVPVKVECSRLSDSLAGSGARTSFGARGGAASQVKEMTARAGGQATSTLGSQAVTQEIYVCRVLAAQSSSKEGHHLHQQRLETLGLLASGVAHDFNNILTGILGHVSYLRAVLEGQAEFAESLNAIEAGAKRSSTMTQQIVRFSKPEAASDILVFDLRGLVGATCVLLKGAIPPKFALRYIPPEEPVMIMGMETQLSQVLVNLVVNARDALENSGNIDVTIEDVIDFGALGRALPAALKQGHQTKYIALKVRDDGKGMPEEVKQRIFEPFFTTKAELGTGLGLSTVRSIVQQLKGGIDISSIVGKGTTVTVFLPLCEVKEVSASVEIVGKQASAQGSSLMTSSSRASQLATGAAQSAAGAAQAATGEEQARVESLGRVLVVDDEPAVRQVVSLSLGHLGYQVDAVASGLEAVERYKVDPDFRYDLIILDMLMPMLSGEETFKELKQIDSRIKVLLMSGYSSEGAIEATLAAGAKDFIPKPFTIDDLSKKVRLILGRKGVGKSQ